MKHERLQAIVLRRTNYGEADRILQLLTPSGRRAAMARGVRREKSKLAGGIELFGVSDVVLASGRGELAILTSARLLEFYDVIIQYYDRLESGYEIIRLVARATETSDSGEWFQLLHQSLAGLNVPTVPLGLVQTWFYLQYSALLGYELSLRYDVDGKLLQASQRYQYDVVERGFRLNQKGEITVNHLKLLRLMEQKPLKALIQIGGISDVLPQCLLIARAHAGV